MIDVLVYVLVLVVSLVAVALNVLSVPGNWVLLVLAVALSAFQGWQSPSVTVLVLILGILLVGEDHTYRRIT